MKPGSRFCRANGEKRNQRILIIDDNTSIHDDVRKILGVPEKADSALDAEAASLFDVKVEAVNDVEFEIDSAFQGQDGLDMVQHALDEGRPYAMAFVDVRMPPGWDGIETISRIWKMYPELQVVICTAYSDHSWEEMINAVGKTDSLVILKKPFDTIEVLQLAHTLTQKWTISNRLQCHLEGLDQLVASRTQELESANNRLREEMMERELAGLELRESEERFAKAFQSSPIPLAIQSLTTERFLDVNEAFLNMSGFARLEIISHTLGELNLCPDVEANSKLFAEMRAGVPLRNFACQLRSRSTGLRDCVISAESIQLGVEPVALFATLDVTEQRSLEKKLRHSQKLEAIGQFAAGVAHDFNNMLTVIQGHASLHMTSPHLSSDVLNSLDQMSLAAERAAGLTRQLLMFSRKQVVQPRVLNVNSIVENLQDMLSRLIGEQVSLSCDLSPNLPTIFADEGNIEQLVVNLAANARDAMSNGGRLMITTEALQVDSAHVSRNPQARPGCHVCLSVTDTGSGMTPETISHIFEPFFTTKEVGKGTGLGLATVYGIISQHEGWIEVDSKINEGTSFKLFLPVHEGHVEAVEDGEAPELGGGSETILVVEDEPCVRDIMTDVLRRHGYNVLEACDSVEAMSVWSEKGAEVDLLVTDIMMPNGMKGNVLAERLLSEKAGLKVIFSSGYSPDFGTESAPLNHRVNFLEKPYRPKVLVNAVRTCLDE